MISSESVATITSASLDAARTAPYTREINISPAISRSILRGRRVEAKRAGITAIVFMIFSRSESPSAPRNLLLYPHWRSVVSQRHHQRHNPSNQTPTKKEVDKKNC